MLYFFVLNSSVSYKTFCLSLPWLASLALSCSLRSWKAGQIYSFRNTYFPYKIYLLTLSSSIKLLLSVLFVFCLFTVAFSVRVFRSSRQSQVRLVEDRLPLRPLLQVHPQESPRKDSQISNDFLLDSFVYFIYVILEKKRRPIES